MLLYAATFFGEAQPYTCNSMFILFKIYLETVFRNVRKKCSEMDIPTRNKTLYSLNAAGD